MSLPSDATSSSASKNEQNSISENVLDEIKESWQNLGSKYLSAQSNPSPGQDAGDANRSAQITRMETTGDDHSELVIPAVTGVISTALRGGLNEPRKAAEITRISTLEADIARLGAGTLRTSRETELADLKNSIRRRGQIHETGAVALAVFADYLMDEHWFANQQSRAATYCADFVAPLFLASQNFIWKFGGMTVSHLFGKIIDRFNQPTIRFDQGNPNEQTLPEYLRNHPEAGVPQATPTPTPYVIHTGVDPNRNGTQKDDDQIRQRNKDRVQDGNPNNIYQ